MQTSLRYAFLILSLFISASQSAAGQAMPSDEAFKVLPALPKGPQITSFLQYQTNMAWRQDAARLESWRNVHSESDLIRLQNELRKNLLNMIGGLPAVRTPLHPRITGSIQMRGFRIEKLIFESLPGVY